VVQNDRQSDRQDERCENERRLPEEWRHVGHNQLETYYEMRAPRRNLNLGERLYSLGAGAHCEALRTLLEGEGFFARSGKSHLSKRLRLILKLSMTFAIGATDRETILNPIWMPVASHRKDNPAAD
jgi:hypothetical protein